MPFLDVNVSLVNCSFLTSVYRKTTHTGVFLNYFAMAPTSWKKGLIFCLLNRAKSICSSASLFNIEVNNLKDMFINNSYPVWFFDNVYKQFLDKLNISSTCNTVDDGTDDNLPYVIFRVSYLGKSSIKFAKNVSDCVANNFPVKVRTVFSTFKVRSYFNLKCSSPSYLSSNVVYSFECMSDSCTDNYIGFTTRHLYERVEEHTACHKQGQSEIKDHLKSCLFCKARGVSHVDFTILRRCRSALQCKLHEAFAIKRFRPVLNKQLFAEGASKILHVWK